MDNAINSLFLVDRLSIFIVLAICLFFVLVMVYSIKFMRGKPGQFKYYVYVMLAAISSIAIALANHLIILLTFWGFLGLILFLLINMGDDDSAGAAKKMLIIVGGSDALMVFGVALIYHITGTFQMNAISIPLSALHTKLASIAYLCLAIGCFAKAGAMPFHSWIPDCAKSAPIPVTAYLPASLDKLLGIYLLVRASLGLFIMDNIMGTFLMIVGAVTIMAAVMMALVQSNMKKLLSYCAISQVGYMVLGIGIGTPIAIAGGLFHMINHAVYKACLFFTAGNVEYRTNTSELDRLGGLSKAMPITYISFLVAALSMSGVPPFNSFVSKWMIYQGIIEKVTMSPGHHVTSLVAAICLVAALFGSTLTVAAALKLLHAVFLGRGKNIEKIREVSSFMWIPPLILAAICVVFGIFAFSIPLKLFVFPATSMFKLVRLSAFTGAWTPRLAVLLIILGLLVGFIIFKLSNLKALFRKDSPFVGGEVLAVPEDNRVTGTDFYRNMEVEGLLGRAYKRAQSGAFDIYEQGKRIFAASRWLQGLHNGVLPTYMVWMLLGMIGLFLILAR